MEGSQSRSGSHRKRGHYAAFGMPSGSPSGLSNDIDTNIRHYEHGRLRPHCFAFCVWACMAIFALVVFIVIIGLSYLAFLQAGMPQVSVRKLNVAKLQVDNSHEMNADILLVVKISNKNEKLKLSYGPLTVDVSSDEVSLGKAKVEAFSQKAHNETSLNVNIRQDKVKVDPDAVEEIRSDLNVHEMVFDVYLSGTIGLALGSMHINSVPFLSTCYAVKQQDVDFGRGPICEVKLFSFRPSTD